MKTCLPTPTSAGRVLRLWLSLAYLLVMAATPTSWADRPALGGLSDIVYANNRFVAVGSAGKLLWSEDGSNWTKSSYSGQQNFMAVVHTGTQFVALSQDGTLVKSANGVTWAFLARPEFEGGMAADLAYGQGVYVMVDSFGYIYASRDGVSWTTEFKPSASIDEELHGVAYANNRFVAVGIHFNSNYDSYGLIRVSTTGFSWTRERQQSNEGLYGVSYADGYFWAVGVRYDSDYNEYSQVLSSPTGSTWTKVVVPGEAALHGISYGKNVLVTGGEMGGLSIREGMAWSQRWSGSSTGIIAAIAYGAGKFVAVGNSGLECISPDGLAWFGKRAKPSQDLSSIAVGTVMLIGGARSLWISDDQQSWANTYYGNVDIEEVTYNNGIYLAVGNYYDDTQQKDMGAILRSTTGRSWEIVRNQADEQLHGITFGKGLHVAAGFRESGLLSYDLILTSPDGRAWTPRSAGTGSEGLGLNAIQFALSKFIAVGEFGTVISSPDGMNWKPIETEFIGSLYDIAHGQGQWAAVGAHGKVLVSSDGSVWNEKSTGQNQTLVSAVFYDDTMFCVGTGGLVLKSADLAAWLPQSSGVTNALNDIGVWQDRLWVVGQGGTILSLTSAQSKPASLEVRIEDSASTSIHLVIRGQAGSAHRLEYCDALGGSSAWIFDKLIQVGQDGAVFIELPRQGPQRYYRCQAE